MSPADNRLPDNRRDSGEYEDKLISLNRVAKAVRGGRNFSFAALVVVGNRKGKVGYGQGKANDVSETIRKAARIATKSVSKIPLVKSTIPYEVIGKYKSAQVILKPAAPGTGIIAGGAVRSVLELCGVADILSKSLGSRNAINIVKAVFHGLSQLNYASEIAQRRGKKVEELWQS